MKLIREYIRNRKVNDVYKALVKNGFCCMMLIDREGTEQYTDREKDHISAKYELAEAYRVIKLEMLVPDNDVEKVISLILENGRTGYHGDGMIIVSSAEEVSKIRTVEKGIESIFFIT